jgi:hypothetical protein
MLILGFNQEWTLPAMTLKKWKKNPPTIKLELEITDI